MAEYISLMLFQLLQQLQSQETSQQVQQLQRQDPRVSAIIHRGQYKKSRSVTLKSLRELTQKTTIYRFLVSK